MVHNELEPRLERPNYTTKITRAAYDREKNKNVSFGKGDRAFYLQ